MGTTNVSMARGNAARTGEMPGPEPVGEPTLRWRFDTGGHVWSTPAVVDGVVYVAAVHPGLDREVLFAIDAASGLERWRVALSWEMSSTHWDQWVESWDTPVFRSSSPACVDGMVFVGDFGGTCRAVDVVTGRELWRFACDARVVSSPAVVDGVVYIGSGLTDGTGRGAPLGQGALYALDATSGALRWRLEGGAFDWSPAIAMGKVYAVSDDGIYALDAATGAVQGTSRR